MILQGVKPRIFNKLNKFGIRVGSSEVEEAVARATARLCSAALSAPWRGRETRRGVDALLRAAVGAGGRLPAGTFAFPRTATPWCPARIDVHDAATARVVDTLPVPPEVAALLPVATEVVRTSTLEGESLQISAASVMVRREDVPDAVETLRILAEASRA